METKDILHTVKRIHMVGIGGSGMSPIAEILHARGYQLTGSDVNESDNIARLRSLRIPIFMEQKAENITGAELVVYTAAVSPANPELTAAKGQGDSPCRACPAAGMITRRYSNTIAVSGTHGKTTTTSMISQILLQAGMDPTLFIGGRLPLIEANGRAGSSDTMIAKACESKTIFWSSSPAVTLILNIDADHLDYFGTLENTSTPSIGLLKWPPGPLSPTPRTPTRKRRWRGLPRKSSPFRLPPGMSLAGQKCRHGTWFLCLL